MSPRTLVIAAHPDDEVLGCGGTIAKLTDSGGIVKVAFLADGVSSREGSETDHRSELLARREAAARACAILGAVAPTFGDLPDNRLDTIAMLHLTRVIESLIDEFAPATVLTHHGSDLNIDHARVHHATVTACRPMQNHPVKTLLFFETPSSTEWQVPGPAAPFMPNWFVDISTTLDRKLQALDAYATELRPWPHPRSREGVEALARWRGATVGVQAAEALVLGRRRA
jgi:N-acetylglucosamine malate deacetylase 1